MISMPGIKHVLSLLPAVLLVGCDVVSFDLRMYSAQTQQFDYEAVQLVFQEQSRVRLSAVENSALESAVQAITAGNADLGLVENSTPFVSGVRAVLPVYKSVLHLLIRDGFDFTDRESPLRGAEFHITNGSQAGRILVELITQRQGLQSGDYTTSGTFDADNTDVIVHFGPIDPHNTLWYRPGFSLASLINEYNPQNEFYQEGIGFNVPNIVPSTIPALTYELPGNRHTLATLSVDTLLVASKSVPVPVIYAVTKTFLEQKPRLRAIAPHLFSGITSDFDPLGLSFPLHEGARRYLERDEPSVVERYAETINMLLYVSFLLLTGLVAFFRWRNHRKKNRIDTFYVRALDIRRRISSESADQLLNQINALEDEAFDWLINEKLAANESFRIFTDLLVRLRQEVKESAEPARTP